MRFLRSAGWIVALFLLNSCSNVSVSNQARSGAPFQRYRTYRMVEEPAARAPSAIDHVLRDAIGRNLDQNRIEPAQPGSPPQFVVRYGFSLRPQGPLDAPGLAYPPSRRQGDPFSRLIQPRPSRFTRSEVAIQIEFEDVGSGKVFWSGEGTEVLDENPVTPIVLNRVVDKILARYPPIQEARAQPGKH